MAYTLMFYNLENLYDTFDDPTTDDDDFTPMGDKRWTRDKYLKKLSNLSEIFSAVSSAHNGFPVVAGVSEVENLKVLQDLAAQKRMAGAHYKCIHFESNDARGVEVGMLYRPDKFTLMGCEPIKLELRSGREYIGRDILSAWGEIDGEMFAFYVCHFPSRRGDKGQDLRARAAEIVYNHALQMQQKYPGIKCIVMGDMNDNPADASLSQYLHGRRNVADVKKGDFFNPFWEMLDNGIGSLYYRGNPNIFDCILVSDALVNGKGLKIKKQSNKYYGTVYSKPYMTQQSGQYKGLPHRTFSNGKFINGYSDHYPTFILLSK